MEHLRAHRGVILMRSALIGAATAAPAVGELLVPALHRGLIHHVVGLWHLDIEDAAVEELLVTSPKTGRLSALSIVGGLLAAVRKTGRLRRLFIGFTILRGLEETSRAFHLATVLDHYCARHSVGAVIGEREARRLREATDQAVATAQQQIGSSLLQSVVEQGVQLLQAVPSWALAKIGRAPTAPLPPLADLSQRARTLLRDVSAQRYIASVVHSFDKKWREATP
jgi:hypothetical protein